MGAIFTVSIIRPYIFIAAIPLAAIFVVLRKYFLRTGQQLKLLEAEGEMEGPVYVCVDLIYLWSVFYCVQCCNQVDQCLLAEFVYIYQLG